MPVMGAVLLGVEASSLVIEEASSVNLNLTISKIREKGC